MLTVVVETKGCDRGFNKNNSCKLTPFYIGALVYCPVRLVLVPINEYVS